MELLPTGVLLPIIVVVAIAGFALVFLGSRGSKRGDGDKVEYPYQKQPFLFSAAERSFLGVLEKTAGAHYRVFGKVRIGDLMKVHSGQSRSHRRSAQNRIDRKHVDFVLCTPSDLSVVCAIELDDSSHQAANRQKRDDFVDRAFGAAGIPLLRFPAKQSYSVRDVEDTLASALPAQSSAVIPQPATAAVVTNHESHAAVPSAETTQCPQCGSDMVVRTARKGANAGQQFLACSTYPKCRATMPLG